MKCMSGWLPLYKWNHIENDSVKVTAVEPSQLPEEHTVLKLDKTRLPP